MHRRSVTAIVVALVIGALVASLASRGDAQRPPGPVSGQPVAGAQVSSGVTLQTVTGLQDEIRAIKDTLREHRTEAKALEVRMRKLDERVDKAASALDKLDSRLDKLDKKVDRMCKNFPSAGLPLPGVVMEKPC